MTNRDIMVLNFINLVGICRTKHIRQLYFKGLTDTVWNRRARFLEEYGELKRFRTPIFEREYIYYSNRKPNQRILRHDLYITDLVTALMDLGIKDVKQIIDLILQDKYLSFAPYNITKEMIKEAIDMLEVLKHEKTF